MEEKKQAEFIVFKVNETMLQGVVSDLFTYGFLLFCIYISRDSTFWTFTSGCLFLLALSAKVALWSDGHKHIFRNKKDLADWVDSLPDA